MPAHRRRAAAGQARARLVINSIVLHSCIWRASHQTIMSFPESPPRPGRPIESDIVVARERRTYMDVGIARQPAAPASKNRPDFAVISHAGRGVHLARQLRMLPSSLAPAANPAHAPLDAPSFAAAACFAGVLIVACSARLQAHAPLDMRSRRTIVVAACPSRAGATRARQRSRGSSQAIRALLDRLETLNVTVYIRPVTFIYSDLEGRVALLAGCGRAPVSGDRAGVRAVAALADGRARPRALSRGRDCERTVGRRHPHARRLSTSASAGRPATPADD